MATVECEVRQRGAMTTRLEAIVVRDKAGEEIRLTNPNEVERLIVDLCRELIPSDGRGRILLRSQVRAMLNTLPTWWRSYG